MIQSDGDSTRSWTVSSGPDGNCLYPRSVGAVDAGRPPAVWEADRALGLVDFTLYPHLNHPEMEDTELSNIQRWASGIPVPTYAIDDNTAIKWSMARSLYPKATGN